MRDAEYFRKQARRCRALAKTAIQPEEIKLFRMWAVDLAAEADEAERRAAKREENHRFRAAEGPSPPGQTGFYDGPETTAVVCENALSRST